MRHRAIIAVLLMLIAVGILLVIPRPDHAVAVTGMVLMIIGAVIAGVGLVLGRRASR